MSQLIRMGLVVLAVGMTMTAQPGETQPVVQAEIMSLLNRVETSNCRFNRNGAWYSGKEAKAHLLTKLHYLENRTTLTSTEQFIGLAASKSSISGKPYLVQCGDAPSLPSATWLTTQLQSLRAARASSPNTSSRPAAPP
ncbi:DUF5329 domain-containing protein [Trinickia sp. EG282A]|uniref:DUF5329 domain-containing protein n=1 Tax=Trinickia sp. EG282A TaxID=3237013 RepID=UPI0034D1DF15